MNKFVYSFNEGNKDMRELLGGKGANLSEMVAIGLPVPKGFVITTEACNKYYSDDKKIDEIKYGIKFSNNNIGVSNKVLTLPFFTLFMLKKVVTYMKDTKFEEFVRC